METPGDDAATIDALLPALRDREHEAFHELYDLMAGPLIAYAHARLGDRSDAEDVVQDVFVKLVRHVRRFRGDGLAMLAWLYKSTRRGCVDAHRRRGRRREKPMARMPDRPDDERAFPRSVWATMDPVLVAALSELTDDQREAIVLRRVAGFDGDEVAAMMGRDRQAVYALCARAEARLRARLAQPALPPARLAGEAHVRVIGAVGAATHGTPARRAPVPSAGQRDDDPPPVWEVEVDEVAVVEGSVDDDVEGFRVLAEIISAEELASVEELDSVEELGLEGSWSEDDGDDTPDTPDTGAGRTNSGHPSDRDDRERPNP